MSEPEPDTQPQEAAETTETAAETTENIVSAVVDEGVVNTAECDEEEVPDNTSEEFAPVDVLDEIWADAESGGEGEGEGEESEEEVLTPEEYEERKTQAEEAKLKGNDAYRGGDYQAAINHYTDAINASPKGNVDASKYYANRAACYSVLNRHEDVVRDCTSALDLEPDYVKALVRRANSNQEIGTLEGLQSALDDYKRALELEPDLTVARKGVRELPPKIEAETERMKDEMLGKLKDLGNTVLGKFGMSLDNFNFVQDPNTGSYSVNFQQ